MLKINKDTLFNWQGLAMFDNKSHVKGPVEFTIDMPEGVHLKFECSYDKESWMPSPVRFASELYLFERTEFFRVRKYEPILVHDTWLEKTWNKFVGLFRPARDDEFGSN